MLFKHLAFYIRDILLILSTDVIGNKDISCVSMVINNVLYIGYPDNEHPSIIDNIFKSNLSNYLLSGDLLNKLCKHIKDYECVNIHYKYKLLENKVYTFLVETSVSICTIMFYIDDKVNIIIMYDDVIRYNVMDKDKFIFSFNCLVECVKSERVELFVHYMNSIGYTIMFNGKVYIVRSELNCFNMNETELVEGITNYLNSVKSMYRFRKEYDEVLLISRLVSTWTLNNNNNNKSIACSIS